jgi:hypothetical protein
MPQTEIHSFLKAGSFPSTHFDVWDDFVVHVRLFFA